MSTAEQPPGLFPNTLLDWEVTLTKALLRTDAGNANAIRSFEITPQTLAAYCGLGVEHAVEAELAFKRALKEDPLLMRCLQYGKFDFSAADVPNCIAILALSLLVDSLLDGHYEDNGQYRAKLAQWLESDRSFMNLRGIAKMWEGLVAWLNTRVDEGAPFRRLILPVIPASWTHIGYTRYLSFPTRRDLRFLSRQIERSPKSTEEPASLVTLLDPLMRDASVSFGLKSAFQDFKLALRSGAVSADHRFWCLVLRAKEIKGQKVGTPADLKMEFNEDGERHFRISSLDLLGTSNPINLVGAVNSSTVISSPNLGPSIRRGVVFFRSSGLASWTATSEIPLGNGPFHLAIAERHIQGIMGALAKFERSGDWRVTSESVSRKSLLAILRQLGINTTKESVRTIELVDGVRVGRAWLGLPRFLPHLEGATSHIEIHPILVDGPSELVWSEDGLSAHGPVDGEFFIGDSEAHWSRRVTFVSAADVHLNMTGTSYALPKLDEWRLGESRGSRSVPSIEIYWSEQAYAYQDVLEALYASLRNGSGEAEAVAIVDRVAGGRSWDMLRTMHESTFLDVRPRPQWRGRIFTLRPPMLTVVDIGGVPGVVVSGSVPSRLERDFQKTISLQGGRAFRRLKISSLSPPLLGAVGIDAKTLSQALGWPLSNELICPDGSAENRLCETKITGDNYQTSSVWNWTLGRFQTGTQVQSGVSLVRLVHQGGRDHDIYRVIGSRRRTFISRHAAIIDAYVQAGRPLFRLEKNIIKRLTAEGALPIELAWALRMRTLFNGGGVEDGWEYSLSSADERWLTSLMPGLIDSAESFVKDNLALSQRRGRGARRPVWENGRISA